MKLRLLLVLAVSAAVMTPVAWAGTHSLTLDPSMPTVATGVAFTVSGKSTGGRDYVAVEVNCVAGGATVYGTRLFVTLDPSTLTGTSQRIYPPASSCTAMLEAPQAIDRFRVLVTVSFTVGLF